MIEAQAGVLPCRQRARHCSDRLPGRRLRAGDGGDQVQASGRILLGLSELSGSSAALMARSQARNQYADTSGWRGSMHRRNAPVLGTYQLSLCEVAFQGDNKVVRQ